MTKCQEKQNHKRVTRRAGTARYAQNGKKRINPNIKPKKVGIKTTHRLPLRDFAAYFMNGNAASIFSD